MALRNPEAPASTVATPAAAAATTGDRRSHSAAPRRGRIASLSPSAVGKDFFTRSVTPSQLTDSAILHTEETPFQERDGVDDGDVPSALAGKEPCADERATEGQGGVKGQLSEDLFASCTESNRDEPENPTAVPKSVALSADVAASRDNPTPPLNTLSPVGVVKKVSSRVRMKDDEEDDHEGTFQLGLRGEQHLEDSNLDYSSPPLLPLLNFPTDTQFELSEDADAGNIGLNRSTTSETSDDRGPATTKSSLFSDVTTARRQKVDVGKGSSDVLAPKRQRDPYQFSQESQDPDMQVIMEKMRSRKKQRSKVACGEKPPGGVADDSHGEVAPGLPQADRVIGATLSQDSSVRPGCGINPQTNPAGVPATSDRVSDNLPTVSVSPSMKDNTRECHRSSSLEVEQLTSKSIEQATSSNVPSNPGASKGCGLTTVVPCTRSLSIPALSGRVPLWSSTLSPAGTGPGGSRSPGIPPTGRRSPFSPLRSPVMSRFPGEGG